MTWAWTCSKVKEASSACLTALTGPLSTTLWRRSCLKSLSRSSFACSGEIARHFRSTRPSTPGPRGSWRPPMASSSPRRWGLVVSSPVWSESGTTPIHPDQRLVLRTLRLTPFKKPWALSWVRTHDLRPRAPTRPRWTSIMPTPGTTSTTSTNGAPKQIRCTGSWMDQDENYYDDVEYGSAGDVFNVEEYDEIYASYGDTRAKMNAMRQSRGFFPVVAIVDRGTSSSPTRQKGKKGKGKLKKGRGSGKGDGGGKQGPISPNIQRRGQAAIGRQICLRCGQPGHWARNCPSSPDKKRKLESEDAVLMVTEVYAMDELDGQEDEPLSTAVQDGGAASVLGSRQSVRRYLYHLMSLGYDLNTVETFRCRKGFRYGNSETEVTDMCLLLPIAVGGRRRKVLTYAVGGTAPLLFGRPLLHRLGLTVDYGKKQMRWPDGNWMPIPLGVKGEHLLELVEDKNLLLDAGQDEETLMPDDFATHIDVVNSMGVKAIMDEMAEMMVADDASVGALCEWVDRTRHEYDKPAQSWDEPPLRIFPCRIVGRRTWCSSEPRPAGDDTVNSRMKRAPLLCTTRRTTSSSVLTWRWRCWPRARCTPWCMQHRWQRRPTNATWNRPVVLLAKARSWSGRCSPERAGYPSAPVTSAHGLRPFRRRPDGTSRRRETEGGSFENWSRRNPMRCW